MENKTNILHTSGRITLAFLAFVLIFVCWIGNVFSYGTQSGTTLDLRRGSRVTDYMFHQPLVDTYTFYFGTQSVTGSGTTGYITGSSTALPRLQYNSSGLTFNFVGATLQNEGVDVTVSSDLTGYIAVSGGTGTGNVLTNPTLAGAGTISANVSLSGNITANSLEITPAELSSVNNASGELQAQITTATGSITNHAHIGSDGTAQIAHDSVTGTGTNSHSTLDTFVSSKAQASGLASLDGNSLVVQNPTNGTTTPTANKIVIADGSGKTADGWLNSTVSLLGQTIELGTETTGNTDNVTEGSSNLYYLDSRVNAAVGSLSVAAHSDIVFTSPAEGHKLVFDSSLNVVNATDTAITAWSGITGVPTDNGSISVTSGDGYMPIGGSDGKLDYSWQKDVLRLTGTTTEQPAGAYGQLYVQSSSSGVFGTETVLLLHMDNPGTSTFVDSSLSAHTITAVGGAIGTSTAKFGSGACTIDSSDDILQLADSDDWNFGTGDFTVDLWYYPFSSAHKACFFTQYAAAQNNVIWFAEATNITFQAELGGTSNVAYYEYTWTRSANTWYHLALVRNGTDLLLFIDGTQITWTSIVTAIGTNTMPDIADVLDIGNNSAGTTYFSNGNLDEFRVSKGVARWTSNFTPPAAPYSTIANYTQYSAKYDDPMTGNTVFEILTPGTATTEPSYFFLNGSGTIIGAGTTTGIVDATSTVYALYVDGASLGSAFQVTSTKSKKENIKKLRIKAGRLEAEAIAKESYIASNKPLWLSLNEANYTYIGSSTATYVDAEAMENDYSSYIELAWASDGSQTVYVDNVQKESEKQFWQVFDVVRPSGWNPLGQPNIDRKGFVVEDMPDVVKGDNGLSIDPMKLIAYMALVIQELKGAAIINFEALNELLTTGTITSGERIIDRLEVMRTSP